MTCTWRESGENTGEFARDSLGSDGRMKKKGTYKKYATRIGRQAKTRKTGARTNSCVILRSMIAVV